MNTQSPMADGSAAPACTVYFDGACPVCSAEIAWYQARLPGEAVTFVDVAARPDNPAADLDRAAALQRFHLRDENGQLVSGARAFIALWARVPRLALLARIAAIPPIPSLLELGYRGFLIVRRAWR